MVANLDQQTFATNDIHVAGQALLRFLCVPFPDRWKKKTFDSLCRHHTDAWFAFAADFGFARYLQNNMMAATLCGSPMYMVSLYFALRCLRRDWARALGVDPRWHFLAGGVAKRVETCDEKIVRFTSWRRSGLRTVQLAFLPQSTTRRCCASECSGWYRTNAQVVISGTALCQLFDIVSVRVCRDASRARGCVFFLCNSTRDSSPAGGFH